MGAPLYVCTMVFNRHDLLKKLLASVAASTRRPDSVIVIDHAYDVAKIQALDFVLDGVPLQVVTLEDPGCAVAANWCFDHVPDDRVTCGDDVQFEPECLERMAATPGDMVIPEPIAELGRTLNPAACCLIRNSCVKKVGYFDEKISPHFLYFEDTDFIRRMALAEVSYVVAPGAHAIHEANGSQTMAHYTPAQMEEHHYRFRIAASNYVKKWGGPPFEEKFTTPEEL